MERLEGKVDKGWGYEIIWATNDKYCGKILFFEKKGNKFSMHFHKDKDETWFINSGIFNLKWVDTNDGKMYQQELKEGSVFHVETLKPCSIECKSSNGSITESNSGHAENDVYITLDKTHF